MTTTTKSVNSIISVPKDLFDQLTENATKRGMKVRAYVEPILKEFVFDGKEQKIILSIPSELTKNNKNELKEWLDKRTKAILETYYKNVDA